MFFIFFFQGELSTLTSPREPAPGQEYLQIDARVIINPVDFEIKQSRSMYIIGHEDRTILKQFTLHSFCSRKIGFTRKPIIDPEKSTVVAR